MIPVADITAEFTTLSTYVLALAAVIITAIGFRFGFAAAFRAIRSVLANASRGAKG